MEGISHEAASLAGTLALGKLIFLYDDNQISLDGPTSLSYTEDVTKRFESYNWQVLSVPDGNDLAALSAAIETAKKDETRPTLIRVRTVIGYGSPRAGTSKAHGEPLGAEGVAATKKFFGFDENVSFAVPDAALKDWRSAIDRGSASEAVWTELFAAYKKAYPELAAEFERIQKSELKSGWEKSLPVFDKPQATRAAGGAILNAIADAVPELIGGAADLTSSTKTIFKPGANFHEDPTGRNIFFGVREFAMSAAVNGMAAHGGLIPFGSTFFVFSDYLKPAMRLAAIMQLHSLWVFTHDSIAVGEDGPTHQPIEQLLGLRAIPHLTDLRPADANETAAAWRIALERKSPSWLALTRQDLPIIDASKVDTYAGVSKGAYILMQADKPNPEQPDVVLIGSGSEVWQAVDAAKLLFAEGIAARVVSFPSWKLFEEQSPAYQASILPKHVPTVVIEAGELLAGGSMLAPRALSSASTGSVHLLQPPQCKPSWVSPQLRSSLQQKNCSASRTIRNRGNKNETRHRFRPRRIRSERGSSCLPGKARP